MSGANGRKHRAATPPPGTVRVAVYTRKSTDEGLEQEFNTLDAQRQAVEAYIQSQRGEGWIALPQQYDDGGYTGANVNRPAFQRLLADIEAGKVDAVCVYKIDRLSRSLLDFARIIEFFEKHGVPFTAVTQQFSTANAMGKLTLNILMSFAEFERQVIAERTADKMSASRRNGLWMGGQPVFGYDIENKQLVVNDEEAARVRQIFRLFIETGLMVATVIEVNRKGWTTKTWTTKGGEVREGKPFDRVSLRRLLTNPVYRGKVRSGDEVFDGVHEAIIDATTWDAAQALLQSHEGNGNGVRYSDSALLKGLVKCGVCGASYSPHSAKNGNRRYRYYVCGTAQKQGAAACPKSRVAADELESFVVEKVMAIGRDTSVVAETLAATKTEKEVELRGLRKEFKRLDKTHGKLRDQKRNLVNSVADTGNGAPALLERIGEVEVEMQEAAEGIEEIRGRIARLEYETIDEQDLKTALATFTPVWQELFPRERARILHLLIEEVVYDARSGEIEIAFRPGGVKALVAKAEEVTA